MGRSIAMQDWPRLLALVDLSLDVPAPQRPGWLRRLKLPLPLEQALHELLNQRRRLERTDFMAALPALVCPGPAEEGRPDAFDVGARIGPWRLLRPLGQGGMSVVWLAERSDGLIRCPVAVKLPHTGPGQELLSRRLLRESRILGVLEHVNIARLIDVGVADCRTPYLAMEYVQGESLLVYADRHRLDLARRLILFDQVLGAVQHAHDQNVLHRDLKPDNVLVSSSGNVKLLDFGIATVLACCAGDDGGVAISRLSDTTCAAGHRLTPCYASPEQWQSLPLGPASDVYALGVILLELLCGQRPHGQAISSAARLEQAVLHQDPEAPSRRVITPAAALARDTTPRALAAELRGPLDAIVLRALARDLRNRYTTVSLLRDDLECWRQCRPARLCTPFAGSRFGRLVGRHRASVGLAAAAGATLLAMAAFMC